MGTQFRPLAEAAINQQQSHWDFLEALLSAEIEEREHNLILRRWRTCACRRQKTLDEFYFSSAPHIPAGKLKELAEGDYIARAEPVLFIGDGNPETFPHLLATSLKSLGVHGQILGRRTGAHPSCDFLLDSRKHRQLLLLTSLLSAVAPFDSGDFPQNLLRLDGLRRDLPRSQRHYLGCRYQLRIN
jgi:hypothetical protein